MAGYIGIDPDPLTFRELVFMVEGKQRQDWEHTASFIAMIHNVNCKKGSHVNADYYNPMVKKKKKKIGDSVGFAAFAAFMKPRLPNHNKYGLIKKGK